MVKTKRSLTGMPTVLIGSLAPNGRSQRRLAAIGLPRRRRRSRLRWMRRRRSRLGWGDVAKLAPYAGTAVTAASVATDLMSELQELKRSGNGKTGLA